MISRITANKSDEAALIVEKIIESETDEVVLIIPRFSHLAESLENFHLLKREADAVDKKLLIESVDNRVIELAELAGVEAINPFFVKNKRQFSDIVPKKDRAAKKSRAADEWKKEEDFLANLSEHAYGEKKRHPVPHAKVGEEKLFSRIKSRLADKFRRNEEEEESSGRRIPYKTAMAVVVLGMAVYAGIFILPKADLKIVAKKTDWSYNDSIVTQTSAKADYKAMTIPNQKFSSTKNMEMSFPATGTKDVANKAAGKITVYNSYSSDPQPLVKNTRFLSPDGKIFLLTKNITVPGAKISEGKIIPSSIDTDVVAEKAGAEYNIGPVKLFTIPGFKGGPKYQAFYGESKENMTGGFVGQLAYATPADITAATKKIKETLESSLKTTLYSQISGDFKIIEGASVFSLLKQENKTEVKDGNFSIFANGQLSITAFKEADLIGILKQKAEADKGENYALKSYEPLEYGIARMDSSGNRMSFPVNFKSVLSYKIDIDALKKQIAGKPETELKKAIFSLPGLDTANVSLWPFWVKKVPTNLNKISIAVD